MENRAWGYVRIQDAPWYPGHALAHGTIANILKAQRLKPALDRVPKTTRAS
jgi:hypothetical protein